jgi:hypothetical protein
MRSFLRFVVTTMFVILFLGAILGIYTNITINAAALQYEVIKSERTLTHKIMHPLTSDHEYVISRLNAK